MDAFPTLENVIISASEGAAPVGCLEGSPLLTCCDIYGNQYGDWVGGIAGQYGQNGNISTDPLFCNAMAEDLRLLAGSPCLHGECSRIGAFGLGCWREAPRIASILDVGNDQGRQVRLRWARSLYDAAGGDTVVSDYGISRRQGQYLRDDRLDGWDYLAKVPARGDTLYQYVAPTLCDSTAEGGI